MTVSKNKYQKKYQKNRKPVFHEWVVLLNGQQLIMKQVLDRVIYWILFEFLMESLIHKTRFQDRLLLGLNANFSNKNLYMFASLSNFKNNLA